jgi:hypothetical protein
MAEMEVEESKIRSTKVEKELVVEPDLGNLLLSDPNQLLLTSLKYARTTNTQLYYVPSDA